jgi:hypothetical protein
LLKAENLRKRPEKRVTGIKSIEEIDRRKE